MAPARSLILLVDDEPRIVELLRLHLEREGMSCLETGSGEQALALAREEKPDLLILDIMLPDLAGTEVCKQIRSWSGQQPSVLMLTAKDEEIDIVVGLEVGADDYVTKPFSVREVVARVKALLRRKRREDQAAEQPPEEDLIEVGDLRIDAGRREASVDGQPVRLTPTEFNLLRYLASNPDRVFERVQLLDKVWGYSYEGYDRTVDCHVTRLRKKLGKCGAHIETMHGVGYRFRMEAEPPSAK